MANRHGLVRIQHQGRRRSFSLETPNQAAGAAKANEIFLHLQAHGRGRTLARYRPEFVKEKKQCATVGDFLSEVKAKADGNPKTIEGYCKSFRKIVADIQDIEKTPKKFDYCSGGHQQWLQEVHKTPLAAIVPTKVQAWKRSFLTRAGNKPAALRHASLVEPIPSKFLLSRSPDNLTSRPVLVALETSMARNVRRFTELVGIALVSAFR